LSLSSENSREAIRIDGLSVRFSERVDPALQQVSEAARAGDVVAITGPSGCGKTTLARTLAGFVPSLIPATVDGELRVCGLDVRATDPAVLSQRIGLVQQDPDAQVCTMRVRQEVAFGPENLCLPVPEVNRRVDEALALVGIEHLVERDTTTLSGGEKQRLAIASILAMQPSVLVLDEPTSSLDPVGAKRIFDTLDRLQRENGQTLVVIEHRLAPLLSMNPRVWVMDGGRIVLRRPTRRREDLVEMGLRTGWPRRPEGARTPGGAVAELERVSFGYGERPVFEDLNLDATSGEILGVIGPNGGGKTTLLRLLAGLERPRSGVVSRIDHVCGIGLLFQHPHQQIFERTVERELAIEGPLSERERSALLRSARLEGLEHAAPLSLSMGEQRRLTMASTLRRDPNLLLLDEPFIGQDRHNAAWMIGSILAARDRGAAVVLVSHDIALVGSLADRILYLGDRHLTGTPAAVFDACRGEGLEAFTPEYWAEAS